VGKISAYDKIVTEHPTKEIIFVYIN